MTGPEDAKLCFSINEVTGEITIKQSLLYKPCAKDTFDVSLFLLFHIIQNIFLFI